MSGELILPASNYFGSCTKVVRGKLYVRLPNTGLNLLNLSFDEEKFRTGKQTQLDIILPGATVDSWQLVQDDVAIAYLGSTGHTSSPFDEVIKNTVNFYDIGLRIKSKDVVCFPHIYMEIHRLSGELIVEVKPAFHREGWMMLNHEISEEDLQNANKQINNLKIYAQVTAYRGRL